MLPWPENSEGTFWASSQAAVCPPVYHTVIVEALYGPFLKLNAQQESCNINFL